MHSTATALTVGCWPTTRLPLSWKASPCGANNGRARCVDPLRGAGSLSLLTGTDHGLRCAPATRSHPATAPRDWVGISNTEEPTRGDRR